jgi:hypothetical protein
MSTIRDIGLKIKLFWTRFSGNLTLIIILILVGLLAFGLGRLSVLYGEKGELKILYPDGQSASAIEGVLGIKRAEAQGLPPPPSGGGGYVASRTGTTYLFPWCAAAAHIAAGKKLYFQTKEEAEAAGFRPGNCNGLK